MWDLETLTLLWRTLALECSDATNVAAEANTGALWQQ